MVSQIQKTVRENWETEAKKPGLSRDAVEYMRPAFEFFTDKPDIYKRFYTDSLLAGSRLSV